MAITGAAKGTVVSAEDFYQGEKKDVVGIDEKDRMSFAKQILLFLFLFTIFIILGSYTAVFVDPENEKLVDLVDTILDITKTVVPSTVTLVLGFYFGKASGNAEG